MISKCQFRRRNRPTSSLIDVEVLPNGVDYCQPKPVIVQKPDRAASRSLEIVLTWWAMTIESSGWPAVPLGKRTSTDTACAELM